MWRSQSFLFAALLAVSFVFAVVLALRGLDSGGGLMLPSRSDHARVTLDFANGTVRAFEGPVPRSMTIAHALRASAKAGHFTFDIAPVTGAGGLMIEGFTNWQVLHNGAAVSKQLDQTFVRQGDALLFLHVP